MRASHRFSVLRDLKLLDIIKNYGEVVVAPLHESVAAIFPRRREETISRRAPSRFLVPDFPGQGKLFQYKIISRYHDDYWFLRNSKNLRML
jgi:hypothetical protein